MKSLERHSIKYSGQISKELLEKEYIHNKKSIAQLSKELNKDWATIKAYLLFYKLAIRTAFEQYSISSIGGKPKYLDILTKEKITKLYLLDKKGISQIAKELKLDPGTIRRYLKKYNIKIRSTKIQMEISHTPKEFIINSEVQSFIDGLLLGDASIPKRKNGSPSRSFTQACKYQEYLEYILKRLLDYKIICSPILSRWINDDRCKNKGYYQSFLQTRRYKTFESFRERWYKKGIKIIPRDLIITPDLLLQSYLSDGNFYREIKLCLDAFSKEDLLFLKQLIDKELEIKCRITNAGLNYELAIKKSDAPKFLSYIGKFPIRCYEYKWQDNESEEIKDRKRLKARITYRNNKNVG